MSPHTPPVTAEHTSASTVPAAKPNRAPSRKPLTIGFAFCGLEYQYTPRQYGAWESPEPALVTTHWPLNSRGSGGRGLSAAHAAGWSWHGSVPGPEMGPAVPPP